MAGDGASVLVVEDDYATRQAIRDLLEQLNFRVLLAADGKEALRICDEEMSAIKLVVSDVVMPEMGGVSLHEALKERGMRVKFLYITGHPLELGGGLDFEHHVSSNPGWVQWLKKPFSVNEFASRVRALIVDDERGN